MLWSLFLAPLAAAQAANGTEMASTMATPASSAAMSGSISGVGSTPVVSTAVPSTTASPDTPVPGQGDYPPVQWWCSDNATFCPGKLLQDVQLAGIFPDSKTFVDKPTNGSLNDTLAAFDAFGPNVTIGNITKFVQEHFKGEGLELEEVEIEGFNPNPAILKNVSDPIYNAWVKQVNEYWTLLIRRTNQSAVCNTTGDNTCVSSLIPLNYTIVVPGGRYREVYYWDSYWILEGLLASELHVYAWNLLQNFMDLIETYGFLPNGGRKYYLNRSQPPVFTQMVHEYVRATGNVTILDRALPLLDQELKWWDTNRTFQYTSPWTNKTHTVAHYAVNNSAPRPEGFVEDYTIVHESEPALNETQKADLYAELATGAESGWDYSSRWAKQPIINVSDNNPVLRTTNVRAVIPVDLMALMAGNHRLLADMYELHQKGAGSNNSSGTGPDAGGGATSTQKVDNPASSSAITGSVTTEAQATSSMMMRRWMRRQDVSAMASDASSAWPSGSGDATSASSAAQPSQSGGAGDGSASGGNNNGTGSEGGLDGNNDGDKVAYHRAKAENYTVAILDLHWSEEKAYFYDFNTSANDRSTVYSPAGLWPLWQNVTPPALENNESLALQIASGQRFLLSRYAGPPSVASVLETGLNWDFPNVWPNHVHTTIRAFETLGNLIRNATTLGNLTTDFGSVTSGQLGLSEGELPAQPQGTVGNTSLWAGGQQHPWPMQMAIEIANRYMTDAFCSWYSTGGSLPGVLEQLPISDLNSTGTYTPESKGHMFEKFNVTDPDAAGGGGEYEVVIGFGWTNGVVLWAAGKYGQYLPQPTCPLIPIVQNNGAGNGTAGNNSNTTAAGNTATTIQGSGAGSSLVSSGTGDATAVAGGGGSPSAPGGDASAPSAPATSAAEPTAAPSDAGNASGSPAGSEAPPPTSAAPASQTGPQIQPTQPGPSSSMDVSSALRSLFGVDATSSTAPAAQSETAQKAALFRGYRIPRN